MRGGFDIPREELEAGWEAEQDRAEMDACEHRTQCKCRFGCNAQKEKKLAILQADVDAIHTQMAAVAAKRTCSCCGGVDDVAVRRLMCDEPVCKHCVYIWYDQGVTDPEECARRSLAKQASCSAMAGK